jgi:hypothetical protein
MRYRFVHQLDQRGLKYTLSIKKLGLIIFFSKKIAFGLPFYSFARLKYLSSSESLDFEENERFSDKIFLL